MRPVKTQIRLGIRPVQSESFIDKDLSVLHADSEDWSDWVGAQADMSSLDARFNAFFFHAAAHMLPGTHVQNEEQTKINAHTGDEEAVLVDLVCFIEAYEAQIRL